MAVRNRSLTVVSVALIFFALEPLSSSATPETSWYSAPLNHVFRVAHLDGKPDAESTKPVAYISRVTKEANTITLKGLVPSEGDLKILQGVAAATSPGAALVDKTKPNANVPDRDIWLAAMTFALRQLAKLDSGTVYLSDANIAIDGVTKADDDFSAVQKKLKEEAPKGLALQISLRPAEVRPFVWLAQIQPNSVSLSGHVPNQSDQDLVEYARALFQNAKLDNAMTLAAGAPGDWLTAAKVSLEMLALLRSGKVTLNDRFIKVDGIYSGPGMGELLNAYRQKLPKDFQLETNISEPVIQAPKTTATRVEDMSLSARSATFNP
jgi:OOP family OmpA-OmpF porin